jgi:hypothetical protein
MEVDLRAENQPEIAFSLWKSGLKSQNRQLSVTEAWAGRDAFRIQW